MQAAYAQKNGCETVDCGTGAEAGSGLVWEAKGPRRWERSRVGPPPRGAAPEAGPLLMVWQVSGATIVGCWR